MLFSTIDPLIATGVVVATAATDAVYVMFTSAVVARHRVIGGDLEQHLVSAVVLRGDPLHRKLALCRIRGSRLLDRRFRLTQFPAPAGTASSVAERARRQLLFRLSPQIC